MDMQAIHPFLSHTMTTVIFLTSCTSSTMWINSTKMKKWISLPSMVSDRRLIHSLGNMKHHRYYLLYMEITALTPLAAQVNPHSFVPVGLPSRE